MCSKGLSNHIDVCLSVNENIENTNNQLKYVVVHSEKMFELFFEGHSTDGAIYDLLELQIQSFLISYYRSPAPPLEYTSLNTWHTNYLSYLCTATVQ